jgi:hypothetical protein
MFGLVLCHCFRACCERDHLNPGLAVCEEILIMLSRRLNDEANYLGSHTASPFSSFIPTIS